MRLGKRKRTEVALSIRKRHFQNLLDEYRQTRRDMIAARRSRQRRARLLRLARRSAIVQRRYAVSAVGAAAQASAHPGPLESPAS